MTLALFDLDNTLLAGDSDHAWGEFLAEKGHVNSEAYARANDRFFVDYQAGTLDINAYCQFVFAVLARNTPDTLAQWHTEFMQERIEPMLLPKAQALLEKHRRLGHTLVIITATNQFVAGPIAKRLGVEHLIATQPEQDANGHYSGQVLGIPCFQEGKIIRLEAWLKDHDDNLDGSWFYSDSRNDLPLLERVTYPVAVDADSILANIADERGWQQLSLRD